MPLTDYSILNPEPLPQSVTPSAAKQLIRRSWAGLLSLVIPGAGQAFNRHWKNASAFLGFSVASFPIAGQLRLLNTFWGLAILALALVGNTLGSASDAVHRGAMRQAQAKLGESEKYYPILFWLLLGIHLTSSFLVDSYLDNVIKYRAYRISSPSMSPTLEPGDRAFADLDAYANSEPARGDIVVYEKEGTTQRWVHRVVAVGGDRIEGVKGRLLLNGRPIRELVPNVEDSLDGDFDAATIPRANFFVMGDNRNNSYDSRYWGTLPQGRIKGRMLYLYFSYKPSRIGKQLNVNSSMHPR